MSQTSNIEWTDATWNPVRGCSRISEGCRNCYAERIAARYSDPGPFAGFAERKYTFKTGGSKQNWEPHWTGRVELIESKLLEPLHWKKPRRVFVNSMSDLFHENLPDEAIDCVFAVMALTPHITYQVLTKRARRMREYYLRPRSVNSDFITMVAASLSQKRLDELTAMPEVWPLPNVSLGVSVENQPTADERIPELLRTPAALRFVSYEPALAEVDFNHLQPDREVEIDCLNGTHGVLRPHGGTNARLDWGIIGGESGPGARPFNLEWARNTIRQFKAAGVPLFVKQLGRHLQWSGSEGDGIRISHAVAADSQGAYGLRWEADLKDPKGGNWDEWPADLRVRQFPETL